MTCVARTVRQHCPAPTRNLSPCPSCDWETRSTSKCLCPTVLQSQSQCEITQHIGHMFGGGVLLLTCLHTAKQMRILLCTPVNSMPQESPTGPLQRPSSPVGKLLENSDFSRLASRSVWHVLTRSVTKHCSSKQAMIRFTCSDVLSQNGPRLDGPHLPELPLDGAECRHRCLGVLHIPLLPPDVADVTSTARMCSVPNCSLDGAANTSMF